VLATNLLSYNPTSYPGWSPEETRLSLARLGSPPCGCVRRQSWRQKRRNVRVMRRRYRIHAGRTTQGSVQVDLRISKSRQGTAFRSAHQQIRERRRSYTCGFLPEWERWAPILPGDTSSTNERNNGAPGPSRHQSAGFRTASAAAGLERGVPSPLPWTGGQQLEVNRGKGGAAGAGDTSRPIREDSIAGRHHRWILNCKTACAEEGPPYREKAGDPCMDPSTS